MLLNSKCRSENVLKVSKVKNKKLSLCYIIIYYCIFLILKNSSKSILMELFTNVKPAL